MAGLCLLWRLCRYEALLDFILRRYDQCDNWEMSTIQTLSITRPDDWHIHLRDGAALATTVPHAAQQFARAKTVFRLRHAHRGGTQKLLPHGGWPRRRAGDELPLSA